MPARAPTSFDAKASDVPLRPDAGAALPVSSRISERASSSDPSGGSSGAKHGSSTSGMLRSSRGRSAPLVRRTAPLAPRLLGLGLAAALPLAVVLALRFGSTSAIGDTGSAVRGALAALGLGPPLPSPAEQGIVALRLWRALTAAGVGAALALSGALVQGLFRNPLASPSVLGIGGGASLGATVAVILVGGYGPNLVLDRAGAGLVWIPLFAFAGALAVAALVQALASRAGAVSIPALLLIGIAVNTFVGGVFQWLQSLFLGDWEVSRSILAWTFGTLDGRAGWHVAVAWSGLALAACVVPFVAWELDLMQAGVEDAEALGVDTVRVRWLALAAASLSAAAAVAVAGQIGFVGLVVPHLVRHLSGRSHRTLLLLSALFGAVFLLALDLAQTAFWSSAALAPGVLMSLIGGPFFVWLLWTRRREIATW